MRMRSVNPADIKQGERYREELGDIDDLAASIQSKGLLQPITVDEDLNLLAGGRRLAACLKLGLDKISVMVRKTEDELDAREVELVENIHRKDMTWHERAALEARIHALMKEKNPKWDQRQQSKLLNQSVGSTNRRLQLATVLEAMPELRDAPNEDAAWKKWKQLQEKMLVKHLREQHKKEGKADPAQWAKDHYKIGDAFEGIEKVAPGVMNFAEVDPPYAVDIKRRKSRSKDHRVVEDYNEIDDAEYSQFVQRMAEEVYRVLRDDAWCIWWYGMSWHSTVHAILQDVGFTVADIPAIWVKSGGGQTASPDTMLGSSYEPFFICRKGQPQLAKAGRSNVFQFSPVPPQKKIHATERPLELMTEILETFTWPGQFVIVPFLGSGNTLRACYKTGRKGVGWDLSKEKRRAFLDRVTQDGVEKTDAPA